MRRYLVFVGELTAVSFIVLSLFLLGTGTAVTYAQDGAEATPTPDRLAQPPTAEAPTQADEGEQLYWLHCQPCHGDVGQGFTEAEDDDWRAQYPPEEKYCWESGCHGERPYEEGFRIPTRVPAVMGDGTLERFYSTAQLHAYIKGAMPYQWPGTLQDEEYLQITAFLAASHGVWDGTVLTTTNLSEFVLNPELIPTPPATAVSNPSPSLEQNTTNREDAAYKGYQPLVATIGIIFGIVVIGGIVWLRRNR